jgi:phosphonate transport system ATP-binding protein
MMAASLDDDCEHTGLVQIHGLSIARQGRSVLHDVSLEFMPRTITAVVGPSGAGKSTLILALNGLLSPSAGCISVSGLGRLSCRHTLQTWRKQTATVFQDHALIGRLSALDNVLLGLADQRHPLSLLPWSASVRERAALALADVGLLALAHTRVDKLSGGERQRVGIARALVRRPRLLLGDEPFASVDSHLARSLCRDLHDLVTRHGLTAVIVLHQLALAGAFAERIVGVSAGRIAWSGPAKAFDASAEALVFRSQRQQREPHVS